MENNSISILLQLSRINLEELKSLLLPDACVLRCARKDSAKVTLTRTSVGRAASSRNSASNAVTLPFLSHSLTPEHALALSYPPEASRTCLLITSKLCTTPRV